MVPDGSMMPFPMPPFDMDMVWMGCACTEYIPCGAGAAELAGQSGERRVVEQLRWEPMGAGRCDSRTAGSGGAFGGGRRRWSVVGCRSSQRAGVVSAATGARCKIPKFQRAGPSSEQDSWTGELVVGPERTSNRSSGEATPNSSSRRRRQTEASRRTGLGGDATMAAMAMMQGRRPRSTITGRRDLRGRRRARRIADGHDRTLQII